MIKNLTLKEAYQVREKLTPPSPPYSTGLTISGLNDANIEMIEVIGPEEWDGCKNAMKHNFVKKRGEAKNGENKGRLFTVMQCALCSDYPSPMVLEWDNKVTG